MAQAQKKKLNRFIWLTRVKEIKRANFIGFWRSLLVFIVNWGRWMKISLLYFYCFAFPPRTYLQRKIKIVKIWYFFITERKIEKNEISSRWNFPTRHWIEYTNWSRVLPMWKIWWHSINDNVLRMKKFSKTKNILEKSLQNLLPFTFGFFLTCFNWLIAKLQLESSQGEIIRLRWFHQNGRNL